MFSIFSKAGVLERLNSICAGCRSGRFLRFPRKNTGGGTGFFLGRKNRSFPDFFIVEKAIYFGRRAIRCRA